MVTNASPIPLGADPEHHVSADDFKAVFRGHPGGVALITADAGDGPVALTATSVASVNVDPPLLMFSVTTVSSATMLSTEFPMRMRYRPGATTQSCASMSQ